MSLLDPTSIPGYAEARHKEQAARDLAFLNLPIPLCGVPVWQMTPRHMLILQRVGNRFIAGGIPRPEDVAGFIWTVSTQYRPGDNATRAEVVAKIALPYGDAVLAVRDYVDSAFMDAPANSGGGKLYTSALVFLVHSLALSYGWDDEAIMGKPLARLWQYVRHLQTVNNPRAPQFNPSDRVIGEWLRGVNERNGAAN